MAVLTTTHICSSLMPFLAICSSDTPKVNSAGIKRGMGVCPTPQSRLGPEASPLCSGTGTAPSGGGLVSYT